MFIKKSGSFAESDCVYYVTRHCNHSMYYIQIKMDRQREYLTQKLVNVDSKKETFLNLSLGEKLIGYIDDCINLIGEIVTDIHGNEIFLIEDIYSENLNYSNSDYQTRIDKIHELLENNYIQKNYDPFFIQIKILYLYETSVLEMFFKTILITMNINVESICIKNNKGVELKNIGCRNRVDLDYKKLEAFCESLTEMKIVCHINDLIDYKPNREILHDTKKCFYVRASKEYPDTYMLYEDTSNTEKYELALVPGIKESIFLQKMFETCDIIYGSFRYHEYNQKWIPCIYEHFTPINNTGAT